MPNYDHAKSNVRLAVKIGVAASIFTSLASFVAAYVPTEGRVGSAPADETTALPAQITPRIIVKYRDDISAPLDANVGVANAQALEGPAQAELEFVRPMSGNAQIFEVTALASGVQFDSMSTADVAKTVQAIADRIAADPAVEYAEVETLMQPQQANDPLFAQQWHYAATAAGINAPGAWPQAAAQGVIVAVIDTGFLPHADLQANLIAGFDFISNAFVANDGDLRDADSSDPGDWQTATDCAPRPARDSSWHGTHVAGTIAAVTNNAIGVAGVAHSARILPVRVLGKCGGLTGDIIDGMRWAAGLPVPGVPANTAPAKVLNLSLGGAGACSAAYQDAVDDLVAASVTVVVSAGNSDADAANFQPASCDGVITVAATNPVGARSFFGRTGAGSNFGSAVEIAAPGGETFRVEANGILSTLNSGTTVPGNDDYGFYQGTSMAAPHVAAVAAMLYELDPTMSPANVLSRLQASAKPFPTVSARQCTTADCGAGIVDASAAVAAMLTGNFGPNKDWTHGPYFGTRGTFFADVDGNGQADAIVVNDDTVVVRRSTGSDFGPDFNANEDWTHGPYFGTRGTFFADVDGNGQADAIVVNDDTVVVRRSTGSDFGPDFNANEDWTHGPYFGTRGTFFADVDGNGQADAIVVNDDTVVVRRSTGSDFGPDFNANEDWTHGPYFGTRGTFFADVDGNGQADAIVVNDDTVVVRRSTGSDFGPDSSANEDWTHGPYFGTRGTFFADVDGNGQADAIVVNDGAATVRRSTGSDFGPDSSANEDWTHGPYFGTRGTFFADVDGNGQADAIVVNNDTVTVRGAR